MTIKEGDVLWTPSAAQMQETRLGAFMTWLGDRHKLMFVDYQSLWEWSIRDTASFWSALWEFFEVQADGNPYPVLESHAMPGTRWFPAAQLNYAEHVFRNASSAYPALLARTETQESTAVSWAELERLTGALSARLRAMGVTAGDRVVSFMPNVPETVIAFLACASMLFGSDFPLITPDRWLKDFAAAGFRPEVQPLILKENACQLFGLA